MARFGRRATSSGSGVVGLAAGPGRRLSSSLGVPAAIETVRGALVDTAPPKREHMGVLFPARITWHGDTPAPAESFECSYNGDLLLLTFAADGTGTLIGLFALDSSEVPMSPLIGTVKMRDGSLGSTGSFPGGTATLHPPALPPTYYADTLKLADVPVSPANELTLARQVVDMVNVKAWQFIADTDRPGADRFTGAHPWSGDPALVDQILHDLGAWNSGVIPYIQDLPWRVRGILLERSDGALLADVWQRMDRTPARPVAHVTPPAARPVAAAVASGYRCANPACAKRGEVLAARQCPSCFHYARQGV